LASIEAVEPPAQVESNSPQGGSVSVDLDFIVQAAAAENNTPLRDSLKDCPTPIEPTSRRFENASLKLSFWQSIALLLVVFSFMIGASGIAAYAVVMAHEWSCRVGLMNRFCPPAPVPPFFGRNLP
jgi:hypothetical protein